MFLHVLVLRFITFSTRDRHWQPLRELCFGGLVQHALLECHAGGKGLAACLRNGRAMKKKHADWWCWLVTWQPDANQLRSGWMRFFQLPQSFHEASQVSQSCWHNPKFFPRHHFHLAEWTDFFLGFGDIYDLDVSLGTESYMEFDSLSFADSIKEKLEEIEQKTQEIWEKSEEFPGTIDVPSAATGMDQGRHTA